MSVPINIVSVVRDFEMYNKCIAQNTFVNHHTLCLLDNSSENKGIPFRYNQFLEGYDFSYPSWLVFCHEDFEFKQSIDDALAALDRNVLYGPIGVRTDIRWGLLYTWRLIGQIIESNKDGSNARYVGSATSTKTLVETFDCQCVIIHSDTIYKTGLRFDENLSFDLYVEDFCINAKENHNIPSHMLPIKCQHWSSGKVGEHYYRQENYLNQKYSHCCYTGTSSYSIGQPCAIRKLNGTLKTFAKNILKNFTTRNEMPKK